MQWDASLDLVQVSPFVENTRLISTVTGFPPLDFFKLMFEEETLDRIAEETNHHTQQLIACQAHPKRYETNLIEMCAFFGIALNILFGNKQVIHSY